MIDSGMGASLARRLLVMLAAVGASNIELQMVNNYFYVVNVTIGNPGQNLSLALDITTSNMWLYGNSSELYFVNDADDKGFYQRNVSSAAVDLGEPEFNLTSPHGCARPQIIKKFDAHMYADAFLLNGVNMGSLRFLLVENYDYGSYAYLPTAGLFGFGQDVLKKGIGLFSHLLHEHGAAAIALYTPREHADNAVLSIGEQSPHAKCAPTSWHYIRTSGTSASTSQFFELPFESVHYGDTVITPPFPYFALSTMTSYVTVDYDTYAAIVDLLKPVFDNKYTKGHFLVECAWRKTAPPLKFGGSNVTFSIPAVDYISQTNSSYCILKVRQNVATFNRRWVVGAPFLRNYCVQFRLDRATVGFVEARHRA